MTLVIDASVAVKAALSEAWADRLAAHELAAPTLLWSETASALRQLAVRGEILDSEAARAVAWLRDASITQHASAELVGDALELAARLGWAKTYDAEYLALARILNVPLVTDDARLQRGAAAVARVLGPQEI